MNPELLKEIYLDQKRIFIRKENLISRDIDLESYIHTSQIVVISGVRRCGKSSLMFLIANAMELEDKDFCYFNFDDNRISTDNEILDSLYNLHRQIYGTEPVFFLDEVQNIVGWEKFVNRLYESGLKVFVTGSNASLLSSEISTSLTGRNKIIELLPFSFSEFLRFRKINIDLSLLDSASKALLVKEFNLFSEMGGFPLVVKENDTEFLNDYFKDILYRDIIARYRITQVEAIKQIGIYFASNIAKLFSYSTLQNITAVKSTASINDYLHYYEQSYLFFYLRKYDFSLKKQILNPRKVFIVDQGLANRLGFSFSSNIGRNIENIVFLQLLRLKLEVFYFSAKGECDFVIKQGIQITKAIQVCFSLNKENYQREVGGLQEALKEYNLNNGILIVYNSDIPIEDLPKEIQIFEIWKWLLNPII
jgi:uncharacterized protein